MANGKITLGKQSGGTLGLVFPDGATDTELVLPESGTVAKTSDINTAGVELKTIASGTATFDTVTNNINLAGIGIGVEIGDVIQISGADDAKNNSEFTVEVITDNNNIIVNQAHANKDTTKNVANRSEDTGVTVKLLAKYYNAPLGLGQDWVSVTGIRISGTDYPSLLKRSMQISYKTAPSKATTMTVNGVVMPGAPSAGPAGSNYAGGEIVAPNSTYSFSGTPVVVCELR